MGISRSDVYTETQTRLAGLAKAMAHPARIAILQMLIKSNACLCGDMVQEIGIAQATVSQHIKELKNIGLLKSSYINGRMCYCIDEKSWNDLKESIGSFIHVNLNNCC